MMTFLIDNKPAIIKNGTTIKLVRENVFFTGSGDYTFEIALPLEGCKQNQEIFGILHYAPISHRLLASKKYSFRLLTELLSLEGIAVITNVTHEEIKIQLLAGNSALNLNALGEKGEQYIDELDLGRAYGDLWDEKYSDYYENDDRVFGGDGSGYANNYIPFWKYQTAENTATWLASLPKSERNKLIHGTRDETDCVCFPIYSLENEAFANEHAVQHWGSNETGEWVDCANNYSLVHNADEWPDDGDKRDITSVSIRCGIQIAPQPYLSFVVERILLALGFILNKTDNDLHTEFGRVFVANARHTVSIAEMLPHWTVDEFFKELKNLFGLYVFVEGDRAYIKKRSRYFEENTKQIYNIISEHTTDIDTEAAQEDTTSGNVAYAFTDSVKMILNIGEDAYEKLNVIKVETLDNAISLYAEMSREEKQASNVLIYVTGTGKRYASLCVDDVFQLIEVDQIGPVFRDNDFKIDKELRIMPAATSRDIVTKRIQHIKVEYDRRDIYKPYASYPSDSYTGDDGGLNGGYHIPYLVTSDSRNKLTGTSWSLHEAIINDTDTDEEVFPKKEIIELGMVSTNAYNSDYIVNEEETIVSTHYPVGVPHLVQDELIVDSLTLKDSNIFDFHDKETAVGKGIHAENVNIDTRVVRQFSFTDNLTNPNLIYLINGRKYACQKIELTVDENGVQPIKTGFFYEI